MKRRSFVSVGIASVIFLALGAPLGADLTPDQVKKAQKLIGVLSAPQLADRQKVAEELIKMGPDVLPLIKKTLEATEDAEVRHHCKIVIEGIARRQKDSAQPGPGHGEDPEELKLNQSWARADAETLRKMKPEDIVKMQIFRMKRTGPGSNDIIDPRFNRHVKQYTTHHFGTEGKDEVAALLAMIQRAKPAGQPRRGVLLAPSPSDHVLVVQPVKGEPFEVLYAEGLGAPFAGLKSRELKEALYLLGEGPLRLSVIHVQDDRVRAVLHQPLGRGLVINRRMTCRLKLNAESGLSLSIKLPGRGPTLMEDTKPMHFGEAKVFASEGPGTYIVLLNRP